MSQTTRAWLYRVGVAAVPILVAYGVLTEDVASQWLGLAGAALGLAQSAIAAANTPTRVEISAD